MWTYFFPILLVILSNSLYHISAKSTPQGLHPFMSLTITYCIAAAFSVLMFFATSHGTSVAAELKKANLFSIVLGIVVVGLEYGYLQVYRVGWNISIASLVANIGLAMVLILVGVFLYHETINFRQLIGFTLCIAGILFINAG